MLAVCHVDKADRSQLLSLFCCCRHQLPDRAARNLPHDTSQTTFDTFDQLQHVLHTPHNFVCLSCVFTFLEIMERNLLEVPPIFFRLQY